MRKGLSILASAILLNLLQSVAGEPVAAVGSQSCMTSGCHGGAGPARGAYNIWKLYDPHFSSAATLTNGRSKAMARQMGIENPATSKSCTACHSPTSCASESPAPPAGHDVDSGVSCANCHGPAQNWLLSHTRPDYPKDALTKLGMRPLGSAYQRANNCVACHQNLSDELVKAKHPPLVFELDGLLVAEPKHWKEGNGFSNTKTWLVGQAVALREASAQAQREPGGRRTAEIEAIRKLLETTGTGWDDNGKNLVIAADEHAKRLSSAPINPDQDRAILIKLISNRDAFDAGAFESVPAEFRSWAAGCYAERLALAIDRMNQSILTSGRAAAVPKDLLDKLFDAAKPPEAFDSAAQKAFVEILDQLAGASTRVRQEQ